MTIFDKIEAVITFLNNLIPKLIILALCLVLLALIIEVKRKLDKRKTQLKKAFKARAHGAVFGKQGLKVVYSPTSREGHIAVFGGSGLGKTTALLIPTLRSWTGTSFTIDISGDICKNVDMPHKMIYEPANPDSLPYNIFEPIDRLKNEDDKNEALEELVLTTDELRFAEYMSTLYADLVYRALWQEPLREDLDQAFDHMQRRVSGEVVMKLFKGSIQPLSRKSPFSLHSIEQITFEDKDTDQREVEGMIKYHGLQAANYQKLNR